MTEALTRTTRTARLERFRALHHAAAPLVLVNCWDVGSALAVARAGAAAVATSSWAVAAARGREDGEHLAVTELLALARATAAATELPLSIDLERGYAADLDDLRGVARDVVASGAVGVNLEDGTPNGLREATEAAERVAAVVEGAEGALLVNARTDLFLTTPEAEHAGLVDEAVERAHAYASAGAESFFVPGLLDPALVARVVERSALPVNVMVSTREQAQQLAASGARRISLGPVAYLAAMDAVAASAAAWLEPLA